MPNESEGGVHSLQVPGLRGHNQAMPALPGCRLSGRQGNTEEPHLPSWVLSNLGKCPKRRGIQKEGDSSILLLVCSPQAEHIVPISTHHLKPFSPNLQTALHLLGVTLTGTGF